MKFTTLIAAITLAFTSLVHADEYTLGDLVIGQTVARATPANAPVSAGYVTITNNGSEADMLIGVSVDFAGKSELHEMAMDGDVMKMREVVGGIVIAAGETVTLKPGGLHLMFMGMQRQLNVGESYPATLTFEKAGTIDVNLNVADLEAIRATMGGKAMPSGHGGHAGQSHGN